MSLERFSRDFPCQFCNEHFPTLDDMGTHLEDCASKTDKCPQCNKYIQRTIFAYHVNHNCVNPDIFKKKSETILLNSINEHINEMNISSNNVEIETHPKFESLFSKASNIQQSLAEVCYQSEVNHVVEKLKFNIIIIMGSPRVGKSSLINALCDGNQAETSSSLNPCTDKMTSYILKDNQFKNPNVKPFEITFYDTPGIESWDNNAGQQTMIQFIEQTNPICVIYCASPGSMAKLDQLQLVLQYCHTKQIFCALVCTNMWSGCHRRQVIEEFKKQLQFFGEQIDKYSNQTLYQNHQITFFGNGALCTMINSTEYSDQDLLGNKIMPVQGIDELIHGIMEALDQDKLLGWCYAVLYRRTYWEKITQKVGGFFQLRFNDLYKLISTLPEGTENNFLAYLNDLMFRKKTE